MVQVREDVVIIRFPLEANRGLIVSLDAEVASDLHGFVIECSRRLADESITFRSGTLA